MNELIMHLYKPQHDSKTSEISNFFEDHTKY